CSGEIIDLLVLDGSNVHVTMTHWCIFLFIGNVESNHGRRHLASLLTKSSYLIGVERSRVEKCQHSRPRSLCALKKLVRHKTYTHQKLTGKSATNFFLVAKHDSFFFMNSRLCRCAPVQRDSFSKGLFVVHVAAT